MESADEDLAERRPGSLAREQARLVRDASPRRALLGRLMGVHTAERAWRVGAEGEWLVAAQLAKLTAKDPRWRVLHAIPVGAKGADLDHLVIGPAGVFTINSKHHPGAKIWVAGDSFRLNGVHQPYVRNSRHEATRAGRLLTAACGFPVTAIGVVVPVNVDELVVKRQPGDVYVVNRRRVRRWLRRQEECLDKSTVSRIYEAARGPVTWRPRH
jgi:hypothetical protein